MSQFPIYQIKVIYYKRFSKWLLLDFGCTASAEGPGSNRLSCPYLIFSPIECSIVYKSLSKYIHHLVDRYCCRTKGFKGTFHQIFVS